MARVAQAEVCVTEIVSIAPAITGERKLDPVGTGRRVPTGSRKNGLAAVIDGYRITFGRLWDGSAEPMTKSFPGIDNDARAVQVQRRGV